MTRHFRIHGDNIVECERTLNIITKAFEAEVKLKPKSPLYKPSYKLKCKNGLMFEIELLSGHGRWGVDIADYLMNNGGMLREGADSYFTEIFGDREKILFALEYCSALPAGNNAWQRSGRAFSTAMANIPYFYFAEIGGAELDKNRVMKAPRFPNPLIPFSYVMMSKRQKCVCVPVYRPHPSITESVYKKFEKAFGYDDAALIIRDLIMDDDYSKNLKSLEQKALTMVKILSDSRKSNDTLRGAEWKDFLNAKNPANWLADNTQDLVWKKKIADKIYVTSSFTKLFAQTSALGCTTLGAKDLPFCIIPEDKKEDFNKLLNKLYKGLKFSFAKQYLVVIWINGFKPGGEDARPDRGLPPLVKMLLGDDAEILTVLFGPGYKSNWDIFKKSPEKLEESNGLFQSVLRISDYILVDSKTCGKPILYKPNKQHKKRNINNLLEQNETKFEFSEHDTDTTIHQIFTKNTDFQLLECLCNPPGGDWSGISFFMPNKEYRWTSLPRVSKTGGKRPDHIFQLKMPKENILLSIESKKNGADLENNVGNNLKGYIDDLFSGLPSAFKTNKKDWRFFDKETLKIENYKIFSIGAFEYKNSDELPKLLKDKQLDAAFAFEFGEITTLHLLTGSKIVSNIVKKSWRGIDGLIIKVH